VTPPIGAGVALIPDLYLLSLDIFAPHARQCGLEIDMDALRRSIAVPVAEQRHATFLNAIYLWACFVSRPEPLSQNEDHYLRLSLDAMPDALQTGRYVDAIRASCLLSLYFLTIGRLPEGTYHASAAASLADQLGFGKSINVPEALDMKTLKSESQEADQVLAFWQAYNLDRCWSVVLQKQPVIADGMTPRTMITAPWPQEISEYKMVRIFMITAPWCKRLPCLHPPGIQCRVSRPMLTVNLSRDMRPNLAKDQPSRRFFLGLFPRTDSPQQRFGLRHRPSSHRPTSWPQNGTPVGSFQRLRPHPVLTLLVRNESLRQVGS